MQACKQIIHGLVISHLDFCNSIFMGLPKQEINRMQKIQNPAAKLVLNCGKYSSSTAALKTLHWLPVQYRILFKVLTLVYKCLHNQAPEYLKKLLHVRKSSHYSLCSNEDGVLLEILRTKAKTYAAWSFSVEGPVQWNRLPRFLRDINNLQDFRKKLKTYLFKEAFA